MLYSERYQKALVTVAMGLREECDIEKNGCIIFTKAKKQKLLDCIFSLFKLKEHLLILKIKKVGFRSEKINITNNTELFEFVNNIDKVFDADNEIWVISSTVLDCWRCRIYLTVNDLEFDKMEMAYSSDDHILDHIKFNENQIVPYVLYSISGSNTKSQIVKSNLDYVKQNETELILKHVLQNFNTQFKQIKEDLRILNINGISLDVRVVDNIYDFHDFDVSYQDVKKVIDFYIPNYLARKPDK